MLHGEGRYVVAFCGDCKGVWTFDRQGAKTSRCKRCGANHAIDPRTLMGACFEKPMLATEVAGLLQPLLEAGRSPSDALLEVHRLMSERRTVVGGTDFAPAA